MLDRQQAPPNRTRSGDGRALQPFRWWQSFRRALFRLRLPDGRGGLHEYAIDIPRRTDTEPEAEAHLYLAGRQHARARLPARFDVPGGRIEVAVTENGVRRSHFVAADGSEHQLVPDPGSPEGRRARLARDHPVASRWIAAVSVLALVIGVGLNGLQILEALSGVPAVHAIIGSFHSPVQLPLWLNVTLGLAAAVASAERALRLRYSWLDAGGN